jgi:hypothetical protein
MIGNSDITEVVPASRIVSQLREQGGTLPCIMLEKDGLEPSDTKTSTSGLDKHTVFIHVFAATWDESNAIARIVRRVVDGFSGDVTIGATHYGVELISFETENNDYYDEQEGLSAIVYQYSISEKRDGSIGDRGQASAWPLDRVIDSDRWDSFDEYVPALGQKVFQNTGIGTVWPWVVGDGETVLTELPFETSGGGSGSVSWSSITGKPSTFTPSAHSHSISDVTDLSTTLASKADLVDGKVITSQLPSIAISDFLGSVSSQSEMLVLTGQVGDWCKRTDEQKTYFIIGSDPSQISSWTSVLVPGSPVDSVNGQSGTVVLGKSDIGLGNVDNTSDLNKPISNAQAVVNAAKQNSLGYTPENAANKGGSNGYASLDSGGKVPSAQLPSFVDDVIEVANFGTLPATGESGKIYVTTDNNKTYRWSGSSYPEISPSPGSTDSVTEGSTNLYFTVARVIASVLTGLSTATSAAITAADTILSAIGKLQAQISGLSSTYMVRANNLSDLGSPSTARTNLGLGTASTQNYSSGSGSLSTTGLSGTPTATYRYERIGKAYFFTIDISGVSSAGTKSFILPDSILASSNQVCYGLGGTDNNVAMTSPNVTVVFASGSGTVSVYRNSGLSTTWTASGNCAIKGTFMLLSQ